MASGCVLTTLGLMPTPTTIARELSQHTPAPTIDSMAADDSPFEGLVFYCTECMTEVPEQLGAGSKCPHCGAFFKSATNADGSETSVDPPRGLSVRVWCGIAIVLIFATEYVFRQLRKRASRATN